MNNWNEGYFTDSTYTYGYYREISPMFQKFVLMLNGYATPEFDWNSSHCELGFGQGVSINIHSATNPGYYIGTDFNPAHASHANDLLASFSDEDARNQFFDDSFAELLERDLPQFDTISFHGIWSWISRDVQKSMVEFVRKFLKPGGICYNSYNSESKLPRNLVRVMLSAYDKYVEKTSSTTNRVHDALDFLKRFIDSEPTKLSNYSDLVNHYEILLKEPADYIPHEYFNRGFDTAYFSEVADMMSNAKLNFACSAEPVDSALDLIFDKDALQQLNSIDNPIHLEQMKDYLRFHPFRKDLYIRGARKLSAVEISKRVSDTKVIFIGKEIKNQYSLPVGSVQFSEEVINNLQAVLVADNYRPKKLSEIANQVNANLVQIVVILMQEGLLYPCQSDDVIKRVKKKTQMLNRYILEQDHLNFLASPVTGTGIFVNKLEKLFLNSLSHGRKNSMDLAKDSWQILKQSGNFIVVKDKKMETDEDNISELNKTAKDFINDRLPIFKALQII